MSSADDRHANWARASGAVRRTSRDESGTQACFVAESAGAGYFPWVLAITPPYAEESLRPAFEARMRAELSELGVMVADRVTAPVTRWVTTACRDVQPLNSEKREGGGPNGDAARRRD